MRRIRTVAPLLGLALAAFGCGNEQAGVTDEPADSLVGRTFLSLSATGAKVPTGLEKSNDVKLVFHDDGRLSAEAGCNTTQGKAKLDGGKIAFSEQASTLMACSDPRLQERDTWIGKVLAAKPTWKVKGDRLTISDGSSKIVLADREKVQPDRPLAKSRWTVAGAFDKEVASSSAGSDRAHIVLADGKVKGSTGCNQLTGTAKVSDGKITFGPITTTRMACPKYADLEDQVLGALKGTVTYEIDGDQLKLTQPSGTGLELRVKPAPKPTPTS